MQEDLDNNRDWYEPDDEYKDYEDDGWHTDELTKSENAYSATAMLFDLLDIAPTIPFAFGNVLKYSLRARYKGQFLSDREKAHTYAKIVMNNKLVLEECESFMYNERMVAYMLYRLMCCPDFDKAFSTNQMTATLIEHALKTLDD